MTRKREHGAYAFQERGPQALQPRQRGRLAELSEMVQSREGVLELLQERASNAVLVCELVTSFIAQEHKAGVPLTEIPVLNKLAAFQNSAQRALRDLYYLMPEEYAPSAELERINKVIDGSIETSDR